MTNCPACGTDIVSQDRFCKNCGAPAAASVEDLADTKRFDPSASTVKTGALDPQSPLYATAPANYPLEATSGYLPRARSFIKDLLHRKLILLMASLLLFLFIGTGLTIGREMVRSRRLRRAEQAQEMHPACPKLNTRICREFLLQA
jgi:zinc-ribbon domain